MINKFIHNFLIICSIMIAFTFFLKGYECVITKLKIEFVLWTTLQNDIGCHLLQIHSFQNYWLQRCSLPMHFLLKVANLISFITPSFFFLYPSIFSLYNYFGVFEIDKKNLFLCKGYATMKRLSLCKTQASFGFAWVGNLIYT